MLTKLSWILDFFQTEKVGTMLIAACFEIFTFDSTKTWTCKPETSEHTQILHSKVRRTWFSSCVLSRISCLIFETCWNKRKENAHSNTQIVEKTTPKNNAPFNCLQFVRVNKLVFFLLNWWNLARFPSTSCGSHPLFAAYCFEAEKHWEHVSSQPANLAFLKKQKTNGIDPQKRNWTPSIITKCYRK